MAASARVLGWAQRYTVNARGTVQVMINGSINTALNPVQDNVVASAQPFEVTAGVSVSVRWGGKVNDATLASISNTQYWVLFLRSDITQNSFDVFALDYVDILLLANNGVATCDRTFTFTPTRSGTMRIVVQYVCDVTATGTRICNLYSDGSSFGAPGSFGAEVIPASHFSEQTAPGLVRVGTPLTAFAQSGGNGSGVYATYGKTIVDTLTTGHAPRTVEAAQTYGISWRNGATQFATTTIPAGTSLTPADAGVLVSNALWPIAAFAPTLVLTPANSGLSTNAGGVGLPWIHYTTVPSAPGTVTRTNDAAGNAVAVTFAGAYTSDPRLPVVHVLQLDNSTYSTPPLSNPTISPLGNRAATQIGFLAARITDANGVGINGLTADLQFWDNTNLVYPFGRVASAGAATVTKGGQTGWTDVAGAPEFYAWSDGLPGGAWFSQWNITTPAAAGLEVGQSRLLTLLAADTSFAMIVAAGPVTAEGDHQHPGDTMRVTTTLISHTARTRVAPDQNSVFVTLIRYSTANNRYEYLAADGTTWINWAGVNTVADQFAMSDAGDGATFIKDFATTGGWGVADVAAVLVQLKKGSTPYAFYVPRELLSKAANAHDSYSFDPTGGLFR